MFFLKLKLGICKDLWDFSGICCFIEKTLALYVRAVIGCITRRGSDICLDRFLLRNQIHKRFWIQRDSFMPFLGVFNIVVTLAFSQLICFHWLCGHDSWYDKVRKCKEIWRVNINNTLIFFLLKRRSSRIHISLIHLRLGKSFINL